MGLEIDPRKFPSPKFGDFEIRIISIVVGCRPTWAAAMCSMHAPGSWSMRVEGGSRRHLANTKGQTR